MHYYTMQAHTDMHTWEKRERRSLTSKKIRRFLYPLENLQLLGLGRLGNCKEEVKKKVRGRREVKGKREIVKVRSGHKGTLPT